MYLVVVLASDDDDDDVSGVAIITIPSTIHSCTDAEKLL